MGQINITLPVMGEGITDATITKYFVKPGDNVSTDTPLVEVATDKVDSEVPSPCPGTIISLAHSEGDIVPVGETLLIIDSPDFQNNSQQIEKQVKIKQEISTYAIPKEVIENNKLNEVNIHKRFLSPIVKQMVHEYSISGNDIEKINGSGLGGKITKEDILKYLEKEHQNQVSTQTEEPVKVEIKSPAKNTNISYETNYSSSEVEIVEMDRMRRLIAEHMVHSVHTSPHVTSYIEVDVTRLVEWRHKVKDEFQKKHNEKLTFMPVFIESAVMSIKDFPLVNVSVDGTNILIRKNIHVGIATALPSGNLIVPVIKNADQKNLIGLAKSLNDLATRARENKLNPDEIKGGTFTITNLGSFGTLAGTPIINQPQAAILAIGEIRKMPAVIETPAGDAIAIRHKAILSLTFDHRVIDGALAGAFLKKISETLQDFDVMRKF